MLYNKQNLKKVTAYAEGEIVKAKHGKKVFEKEIKCHFFKLLKTKLLLFFFANFRCK